jgi:hypothetical protein
MCTAHSCHVLLPGDKLRVGCGEVCGAFGSEGDARFFVAGGQLGDAARIVYAGAHGMHANCTE